VAWHCLSVTLQRPSVLTCLGQLDKLVISQLGLLAQRRLARGVKLNHAEATVSDSVSAGMTMSD
jgi:urease gamma subunit